MEEAVSDLLEHVATFSAGFPIDFARGKLSGKFTNVDKATIECCSHHKWKMVAKHPDCDHVTPGCCDVWNLVEWS